MIKRNNRSRRRRRRRRKPTNSLRCTMVGADFSTDGGGSAEVITQSRTNSLFPPFYLFKFYRRKLWRSSLCRSSRH